MVTAVGYTSSKGKGKGDVWLVKFKENGEVLWDVTFGSPNEDRGYGVVGLPAGYLAVGRSFAKSTNNSDGWVVRTDLAGTELWNTYLGGTLSETLYSVVQAQDGFMVVGITNSTGKGGYDAWLSRLDNSGTKLWDTAYGTTGDDYAYEIDKVADGWVIAGSYGKTSNTSAKPWLVRFDSLGKPVWWKNHGGGNDIHYGVTALADGSILAAGVDSTGQDSTEDEGWFLRVDKDGEILTEFKFGGGDDDYFVAALPAGTGYVIGGATESKNANATYEAWLMRIDAFGFKSCKESGVCATKPTCDDANPCTLDACDAVKGCVHTKTPGCCNANAECADGETKCTTDTCSNGTCKHTATGAPGCCDPTLLDVTFEDGKLDPLSVSNSSSQSKWQATDKGLVHGGKWAAYYGNLAKKTYDDGDTSGTLTTGNLTIPTNATTKLKFWLYLDVESELKHDQFTVKVFPSGGTTAVLWTKGQVGWKSDTWQPWALDLTAWAGKSVKVEFMFDTVDDKENGGEGVYLDDVYLERSCP